MPVALVATGFSIVFPVVEFAATGIVEFDLEGEDVEDDVFTWEGPEETAGGETTLGEECNTSIAIRLTTAAGTIIRTNRRDFFIKQTWIEIAK